MAERGRTSACIAATCMVAALAFLSTAPRADEPLLGPRQSRAFQQACAHCHVKPGIGVPVLGDEAAWAPRRAQGFDVLVAHVVEGRGGMPPLGTCSFCTEDDLRRLAAFVAGYAQLPETSARASEAQP